MKIKGLLTCLALIMLLIVFLTACNNTDTNSNTETSTETNTNTSTSQECEHELELVKGTAPTCTKDGMPDYTACKKCELCIIPSIALPALGHTKETIPAVMPTCTEDGKTSGTKCSVCGEILTEQDTIPSKGHLEQELKSVEPTCTKDGLTAGKSCIVCKEVLIKQEVIKAQGHNDVNGYCSVCGEGLWAPEPTDEDLTIIKDGSSDFIIVYEYENEDLELFANELATHIKTKYGVLLPVYDYYEKPSATHEIVIGMASTNSKYVKRKIATSNDFIFDVCGDDLIIYAPNKYLYSYMLNVAKLELFNSESSLTLTADTCFTYQESEYKSYNYAEYLKNKYNAFDANLLLNIFDEETYEASDGTTVIPYRIYVPSDYDPSKSYPLLTILHGAGERGNDNTSQLKNMVSNLFNQENSPYMDAIVICPQCPSNQQWVDTPWGVGNYSIDNVPVSNELTCVVEIITSAQCDLNVDTNRLYLMGLSMGGFGVWDLLMRNTSMFAGAVALCGGADVSQAPFLTSIPIWAVHGKNDRENSVVPYTGTEAMCQAIADAGGTLCIADLKEGYGHNVWDYAGNSTEIAKWLFEQSK